MAAITFPMSPMDGDTYAFGGTDYEYDSANNRWLAQAAGGATVVVSQTRPDPTMGSAGIYGGTAEQMVRTLASSH